MSSGDARKSGNRGPSKKSALIWELSQSAANGSGQLQALVGLSIFLAASAATRCLNDSWHTKQPLKVIGNFLSSASGDGFIRARQLFAKHVLAVPTNVFLLRMQRLIVGKTNLRTGVSQELLLIGAVLSK